MNKSDMPTTVSNGTSTEPNAASENVHVQTEGESSDTPDASDHITENGIGGGNIAAAVVVGLATIFATYFSTRHIAQDITAALVEEMKKYTRDYEFTKKGTKLSTL